MTSRYEFEWANTPLPKQLSDWRSAPIDLGFYELGFYEKDSKSKLQFYPKYGGLTEVSLTNRLRQHWMNSHNPEVRKHRHRVWYRCRVFKNTLDARIVEGHYIVAMDYPWNKRNEWKQIAELI